MIYRPTDDRDKYELYSVGWDGIDHNGWIKPQLHGRGARKQQTRRRLGLESAQITIQ